MRHALAGLALLCIVPGAGRAEEAGTTIEGVISGQIEAFRADDFERAFGYASPGIRHTFVTPESFGEMVRGGYPMVLDPQDFRFLGLREQAGALWQRVLVIDLEGTLHTLDYRMIQAGDGWRIDAVVLLPVDEGES